MISPDCSSGKAAAVLTSPWVCKVQTFMQGGQVQKLHSKLWFSVPPPHFIEVLFLINKLQHFCAIFILPRIFALIYVGDGL